MKKLIALTLLLAFLTGCTGPQSPETTVPATVLTTAPAETLAAPLRSGFYELVSTAVEGSESEAAEDANSYLRLDDDGTGVLNTLGVSWDVAWNENQILFYGEPLAITSDGNTITLVLNSLDMTFRYQGETMPEKYLPRLPVGYFLVSSVGRDGDVEFYGSLDPENGSLTLNADGTGTLALDILAGDVTIDENYIRCNGMDIPYFYTPAEKSPDGEEMLAIYLIGDVVVSVIFRTAPAPSE